MEAAPQKEAGMSSQQDAQNADKKGGNPMTGLQSLQTKEPVQDAEVSSDASWDRDHVQGGAEVSRQPSHNNYYLALAVFVAILSVVIACFVATRDTSPSFCVLTGPLTMTGAFSRSRAECALDSCLAQFNGTVVNVSGKDMYIKTWQDQGFPAMNCPGDLGQETWLKAMPRNCSGQWPELSPCPVSCGGGLRSSTFQVFHAAENGGICDEMNRSRTERCNEQLCPVDCELEDWTPDVNGCSKLCDNGTLKESRAVKKDAQHGGSCPEPSSALRERRTSCNTDPCDVSLIEDFQDTLVATRVSVDSIQDALGSSRRLSVELLQNHPEFNCAAGITEEMKDAAAACAKNNELAKHTDEMSLLFEKVQDDCGLVVPHYKELMESSVTDLPALMYYVCSQDVLSASSTITLLTDHVKTLLDQIDQCRSSSKDLTAKNKQILGRRSGHTQDTKRSIEHLNTELKGFEVDDTALKTDLLARADALEEDKRLVDEAKEKLKKSKDQFEQFKAHQLGVLNAHESKDETAREEAKRERQYARNLDDSLRGKNRDENRINRAKEYANEREIYSQKKRAEYEAKVDEYNRAMAHQESTLKAGEDALQQHTLRIAQNERLSQVARDKQLQVSKKIRTNYLERRNLLRFQKMSEASDQSHLDAQLADASKNFREFAVKFKKIHDYLSSLIGEEGRVRTGQEGCTYVKHIVKNVVNAARGR